MEKIESHNFGRCLVQIDRSKPLRASHSTLEATYIAMKHRSLASLIYTEQDGLWSYDRIVIAENWNSSH